MKRQMYEEDQQAPPQVFGKYQYAFKKNGMEQVIHSFSLYNNIDSSLDKVTLDANNAFPKNNNRLGLAQCELQFPEAVTVTVTVINLEFI